MPRTVKADEALRLGIATEVVPDDELAARTAEVATRLASGPTVAYASIKRAVAYAATHDLSSTLEYEASKMALTGATADHAEAVEAFLAKRSPMFEGR
jgi:2-(1,2-epoxy-1,2-dihydrophenyl)acetyl-CoA isomerase